VILEAKNLQKKFGNQTAVNGLSLSVKPGEFYSLLGPNGAGKSTTIHILSALLFPDSGSVTIKGTSTTDDSLKIKKILGIVPQEISLYDDLTAEENLHFWGKLYGVKRSELNSRIESQLKEFGLYDRRKDRIKTYSGGMKRRINIAAALLHEPEIVFMDEPTVGIDPQSRNNIYDALQRLKTNGITILYTTHYMEEAERFSDRVGIIDAGKIIAEGSVEELKRISKVKEDITIHTSDLSSSQMNQLTGKFPAVRFSGGILSIETDDVKKELISVLNFCSSLSMEIDQVEIHKANLEKVFLSLTGKKLRD